MVVRRIPLDVVHEILVLLPAKSLLRFRCVCKAWYNLIDSPLFVKLHLNKSLEPNSRQNRALISTEIFHIVDDLYHPLKWRTNWPKDVRDNDHCDVVGTCNGLVCYKLIVSNYNTAKRQDDFAVRCFLICSPITRPFKLILPPSEKKWTHGCSSLSYSFLSYGFGYDNEHDDYKIVVTSNVWRGNDIDVRIYSLKADSWSYPTSPTLVSSGKRRWKINRQNVIYKDKMLHYLVSADIVGDGSYRDCRIARFDVVSEKWRNDLCYPIQLKETSNLRLGELEGQLYLRVGSDSSDVWMMEEDDDGSWKKMFHLPKDLLWHSLIARSKDGHNRLLVGFGGLTWYDQRDNARIPFYMKDYQLPMYISFMLCIASLVKIPE